MTNPEDSAPNFGIFKFIQSISTFAGYFGLLKLKIQIQVTILGRTLIKTHQHLSRDLCFSSVQLCLKHFIFPHHQPGAANIQLVTC